MCRFKIVIGVIIILIHFQCIAGDLSKDRIIREGNPNQAQCKNPLGMESGDIKDQAISASSSYNEKRVGPANARIRTETNAGAWCPKIRVDRNSYEYLQIDLERLTVITMVEIQGRFDNGQGQEFSEEFILEYQRTDDGEWLRAHNKDGEELFVGNRNTYSAEVRDLSPPIIGKRLRFVPYCRKLCTVCIRVEIYGCTWQDDMLSYSMAQGNRLGTDVDLSDNTYDGIISQNYLYNGLGQLTDGEKGETFFLSESQDLSVKGYEWVGWEHDDVNEADPVEILFEFNTVRNFTSVIMYCSNYFSKNIRVFKKAVIHYSIGGKYFEQKKDEFHYVRDSIVEYARNVLIRLDNVIARYIKIELYFDAKWILISEVKFESKPAIGNFDAELPPKTTASTNTTHNDELEESANDDGFDELPSETTPSTQEINGTAINTTPLPPTTEPKQKRQKITKEMLLEAKHQFYQERILTERRTRQLMDVQEDFYKAVTIALEDESMLSDVLLRLKKT